MIGAAYDALIHDPLRNALVALLSVVPGGSLGIAVILLTVVVRFALFPLSKRAVLSQIRIREVEPKIAEIRAKHKDNPQRMTIETMAVYRENGIKPFSSFLLILVQIPILIGLYTVFRESFTAIDPTSLYPFVPVPGSVDPHFLGISLETKGTGLIFAIVAAVLQYVAARITLRYAPVPEGKPGESFQADFARGIRFQTLYVFPVITLFAALPWVAAIPLYWATGNLFTVLQELYLSSHRKAAFAPKASN